ncbi:wall-associated receptor kinase 3-like isoform X2 [Neltuma alba]|uniref:wall-associated receptor kinase 3-like isoform X2 n=1 Tax=Neltuma alba TaxID=207710 RepID=UPI0010A2B3C1|nr:wall-associated receptor kinase 3-like isoform X2 [Prosopis alba]
MVFYSTNASDDYARCSSAFVEKNETLNPVVDGNLKERRESNRSKVILDWAVDQNKSSCRGACKSDNAECEESESVSGYYYCKCETGFKGNPYTAGGCKDVDECQHINLNNCLHKDRCHNTPGGYTCSCPHGQKGNGRRNETEPVVTLALLGAFTLVSTLCWAHKQRSLMQLRQRNFEQNGGNLLLQQLSQQQRYTDRTRIFTKVELKNATNNFDESRILGRGGQGTVYKGILPDNTIVAIKKSRVGGDPQNIKSFINEVFVLSQINHRHVVKLLGCCLETEVPLLVYEFVENGSLLDHLDPSKNECSITWETRLRIATETAEAISYLHSAASIPIIHRDIKSANILLDHNDRAKVSDFGASRLVHLGEAQVATVVQGTIGYLDPEYLQTGQLNEKSDVYSFGIVLLELLTGSKAFKFNTLASHFVSSMREDRLWEILDRRVLDQKKNAKQLKEVALLASRCIRVNGEERPTMKEVAMELEGLIAMEKHLQEKDKDMMKAEESEYLLGHYTNDGYGSASASFSVASHDSIQKQVAFEIIDGGR